MNDDLQHNIKFWFVLEHYGDYEIILYSNGEMLKKAGFHRCSMKGGNFTNYTICIEKVTKRSKMMKIVLFALLICVSMEIWKKK